MSEETEEDDASLLSNELNMEEDRNSNTFSKNPTYRSSDTNTIHAKKCCLPTPKEEIFNNVWIFDSIIKLVYVRIQTQNIFYILCI